MSFVHKNYAQAEIIQFIFNKLFKAIVLNLAVVTINIIIRLQ